MFDSRPYHLASSSASLLTPSLLAYPRFIESNIAACLQIAGSVERLRPHVKTHKCAEIVKILLVARIRKHKCATLGEARMLAEAGAADVLIAYPLIESAAERLSDFVSQFPACKFSTVIDCESHLVGLERCMARHDVKLDVLLDLDTGMHRTGIQPGPAAIDLYQKLVSSERLQPAGFHVYDGQNHQANLSERVSAVQELMQPVIAMVETLRREGVPVPKLVCGGTPTYGVFAQWASELEHRLDLQLECSPGTCILSDYNYGRDYPDLQGIQPAAVLLTRVISKPCEGHVTVDLGYKAIASDPPAGKRCYFLDLPDAVEVQHSEEHLVIRTSRASELAIGSMLYVLPAHICPTVALHSHFQVVESGRVVDSWSVGARERLYSNCRSLD